MWHVAGDRVEVGRCRRTCWVTPFQAKVKGIFTTQFNTCLLSDKPWAPLSSIWNSAFSTSWWTKSLPVETILQYTPNKLYPECLLSSSTGAVELYAPAEAILLAAFLDGGYWWSRSASQLAKMVHTCDPSPWKEGAGKLFKAGLGYIMRSKDSSHNKSVDQFFSWEFGLEMVQRGKLDNKSTAHTLGFVSSHVPACWLGCRGNQSAKNKREKYSLEARSRCRNQKDSRFFLRCSYKISHLDSKNIPASSK